MPRLGHSKHKCIATLLLTFGLSEAAARPFDLPSGLEGCWRQSTANNTLCVESERFILWADGHLRVLALLEAKGGRLLVRRAGLVETWVPSIDGETLRMSQAGVERHYRRLKDVPEATRLDPLPLAAPKPLTAAQVAEVQRDLAERLARDQAANRNDELKPDEVQKVVEDNSRHLRSLAQEVGWIDAGRFGSKTAYTAVILAKHGGDLRLLLSVLPLVERDFRHAGDDSQAFAIVYDAVQLDLGRKQRYGTQIRGVGGPSPFLVPLEDLSKVDIFRKEIGLPPLEKYLADAEEALKMKVAMPPADEASVPPRGAPSLEPSGPRSDTQSPPR